jgi:DNA-binding HxlR family transcriptional regulator
MVRAHVSTKLTGKHNRGLIGVPLYHARARQISTVETNRNITMYKQRMGATKADEFSVKDNRLARYAKALAHPARVAILRLLAKRQACVCGDIVDELPIAQSTVSQHLKELKAAGLIKGDIEGAKVCYCIDEKEWNAAQDALVEFFNAQKLPAAKCC